MDCVVRTSNKEEFFRALKIFEEVGVPVDISYGKDYYTHYTRQLGWWWHDGCITPIYTHLLLQDRNEIPLDNLKTFLQLALL
jgi:hypothetical protein